MLSTIYRKEKYIENYAINSSGAKEIRVHSLQKWLLNQYRELMTEQDKQGKKLRVLGVIGDIINNLVVGIQNLAVYLIIAYQVISGYLLTGDFLLFINSVFLFSDSLTRIIELYGDIMDHNILMTSLREFMTNTDTVDVDTTEQELPEFESIRFENVCFKYPNSEKYALKNVNLTIKKGERIMIVGRNGAGKTTLIKLLCGFNKPDKGSIYFNDKNIQDINYSEYMKCIGTVFQDFTLIAGSVRENTVCNLSYDAPRIQYAFQESGFADRLNKMDQGEATEIYKYFDERGVELSGGEAQKLAIARLIYRNPDVYILDEPTSALDPIAEYEIYQRFTETVQGKTSIFISHRLTGADTYDRIIVFENGEVEEDGTFSELLKCHAAFAEMYHAQAGHYLAYE